MIVIATGDYKIADENLGGYSANKECDVTIGEGDSLLSELFDKVLMSMKEGETCYVKSKVDNAGNQVRDFEMTAKKALKFNVQLASFSRAADTADLESDEKLERAQNHKNKGTDLFRVARFPFAIKRYKRALQCLEDFGGDVSTDMARLGRDLACHCHLNLAACGIKNHNYRAVIEHCTEALRVDRCSVKGLFRRGQAYLKLHCYVEARSDLNAALVVEPNNKAVLNELRNTDILLRKEKELYQKMFPGQKASTE